MPGYRRFIAYVYAYDQGKKGDGKGFIKVEVRNGICRMNFKLEGILGRDSAYAKIYGYVREGQNSQGVLLGQGNLAGNPAEFELEMEEDHMGNSSYSLENLGGLLILGENGEIYASGWDDRPVRPENIQLPEEELAEEEPLEEELPEAGAALPQETVREMPEENETREVPEIDEDLGRKADWKQEEEELLDADTGSAEETNIRLADAPELEGQSAAAERKNFSPFPDEEFTDCRKISMKEIRNLGRRDRGLVNNSFLRYGMKNYGHLLFGKKEEDGRYILGIPGIYERQESLMATMFGFPYFKECRNPGGKQGRFGYWYRFIDPPEF